MLRPTLLWLGCVWLGACAGATTDKGDDTDAVETDGVETDATDGVETDVADTDATDLPDTDATDLPDTDETDGVETDATDLPDTDAVDSDTDVPGDPALFLELTFDGGLANDSSPNAWTRTSTGTVYTDTDPHGNASGALIGSTCLTYGATTFDTSAGAVAIAFWIKPMDGTPNTNDVVESNYGPFLVKSFVGNIWELSLFDAAALSHRFFQPAATEVADTWVHIAFSVDLNAGTAKGWRNGVPVVLTVDRAVPATLRAAVNKQISVGCGIDARLDDLRVWSRPLSDAEVVTMATL